MNMDHGQVTAIDSLPEARKSTVFNAAAADKEFFLPSDQEYTDAGDSSDEELRSYLNVFWPTGTVTMSKSRSRSRSRSRTPSPAPRWLRSGRRTGQRRKQRKRRSNRAMLQDDC